MMTPDLLKFGVLLVPWHQWQDQAGPVDFLHSLTYEFPGGNSTHLAPLPLEFHYVSPIPDSLAPVQASAGPTQNPTCTYSTCPKFDIIFVPGPSLDFRPDAEMTSFLHRATRDAHYVLSVCTGSLVLAHAGLLKGKKAASNKWGLKTLAATGDVPKGVEWSRKGRWTVDGKRKKWWSSAGVTAGIDMAVGFVREIWPEKEALVETVLEIWEFTPRGQGEDDYEYILDGVEW